MKFDELSPRAVFAVAAAGGMLVVTTCLWGAHWLFSVLVTLFGVQ
jgi:hypothetical protein